MSCVVLEKCHTHIKGSRKLRLSSSRSLLTRLMRTAYLDVHPGLNVGRITKSTLRIIRDRIHLNLNYPKSIQLNPNQQIFPPLELCLNRHALKKAPSPPDPLIPSPRWIFAWARSRSSCRQRLRRRRWPSVKRRRKRSHAADRGRALTLVG